MPIRRKYIGEGRMNDLRWHVSHCFVLRGFFQEDGREATVRPSPQQPSKQCNELPDAHQGTDASTSSKRKAGAFGHPPFPENAPPPHDPPKRKAGFKNPAFRMQSSFGI
jgi:hypothetical protein